MQTIEQVEARHGLDNEVAKLRNRIRWLSWACGLLAVVVVVLGTWMIVDEGGQSLTAQQEQMLETVDAAAVAWNAHDGEALAALYATESGYHDNGISKYYVRDGELASFVDGLETLNFSSKAGERYVLGTYVVSYDFIPANSQTKVFSIHKMSTDGSKIVWHRAADAF